MKTNDREVMISVSDTGIGIAEELLPHIFDKFYRVENIVHTKEGTGIGLALVRGIVDYHGGRVEVASRLGAGTVFTVYLPKNMNADIGTASTSEESEDLIS